MANLEYSIKTLAYLEEDERFSIEDLESFGYTDVLSFYTEYEEVIDSIVMYIYEPETGEYGRSNFNVIKSFVTDLYPDRYNEYLDGESYHIIDVGNEDYYIVVWFELTPYQYDDIFQIMDYQYNKRKVTLLKKGNYATYLLTLNRIEELV